jgi:hypothetical protein
MDILKDSREFLRLTVCAATLTLMLLPGCTPSRMSGPSPLRHEFVAHRTWDNLTILNTTPQNATVSTSHTKRAIESHVGAAHLADDALWLEYRVLLPEEVPPVSAVNSVHAHARLGNVEISGNEGEIYFSIDPYPVKFKSRKTGWRPQNAPSFKVEYKEHRDSTDPASRSKCYYFYIPYIISDQQYGELERLATIDLDGIRFAASTK